MKVRNVVFDFGRVLVDWSRHYLYDGYFGDVEKAEWFIQNVVTSKWCMKSDSGIPFSETIPELQAEWPEYAEAIQLFHDRWMEMCRGPWPGMSELIDQLRSEGYGIYGLSNWPREFFMPAREKVETLQKVDDYVVSSDVGLVKPDARIYNLLLSKYGLKPEECVFVDDVQANVDGARAVGMHAILFDGRPECVKEFLVLY